MSQDNNPLESELRSLRPANLDAALLDRLDACADESWTSLGPLEKQLEKELQAKRPSSLSPTLLASLEAATHGIPFPANKTVTRFPEKSARAKSSHYRWSAAAAVALMGALTALMVPTDNQPSSANQAAQPTPQIAPPPFANNHVVPAEFTRNLSEATDEGVVWQSSQQPHRVVKVVYRDRVTLKRKDGSTYQVEQPRVEYYMVPTTSD